MKMRHLCLLAVGLFLLAPHPVSAGEGAFSSWLASVRQEALQKGVSPATLDDALQGLVPNDRVIVLDNKQPEKRLGFATYIKQTLNPLRVRKGSVLLTQNASLLRRIGHKYGVAPEIIVALWGMESNFGANTGGFSVIESLATLAYDSRRPALFRQELIQALRVMDSEHISSDSLTGSWAGAMGQCQFMPSTFARYAVDYDGDGRRDIWDSQQDVWASIAHYIASEGWRPGYSWGREVRLKRRISPNLVGLDTKKQLAAWDKLGVVSLSGKPLPKATLSASLIKPDGAGGRAFLVYDNFRALMRWNHSTYFALSVGMLADRLHFVR